MTSQSEAGPTPAAPKGIDRRHDLDALRAFAMLLGIVLHAALTFVPDAWAVQDERQSDWFGLAVSAIHGFRMPVFFLMSGFFTAMLWRRRGLNALIEHRLSRVLLPLLLGMVFVVPATCVIWGFVTPSPEAEDSAKVEQPVQEDSAKAEQGERATDIWRAAYGGDVAAVELALSQGAAIDEQDPTFGVTPLAWASMNGHEDAARLLLRSGAGVDARNRDGSAPLHSAVFAGRQEIVKILLDYGADVHAKNSNGETPLDSAKVDFGTTEYIFGLFGMAYDAGRIKEGRGQAAKLIASPIEVYDDGKDDEVKDDDVEPDDDAREDDHGVLPSYWRVVYSDVLTVGGSDEEDPFNFMHSDLFQHLWFLRDLLWLVGLFAIYAYAADRFGWTKMLPRVLVLSPARYVWLLPPTFCLTWFMGIEGALPFFGPDTSTGLVPLPHLLLYYAIFFFFGAIYYEHRDDGLEIGRWWWAALPLGLLAIFPLAMDLEFASFGWFDSHAETEWPRFLSVLLHSLYPWLMTFGLMGLFRAIMARGRYSVRYVSDASYWLYIMHLSLIVLLQYWVREWPLPAIIKFAFICLLSTGSLLLMYQAVVRYTWLGALLNGPRRRPAQTAGG